MNKNHIAQATKIATDRGTIQSELLQEKLHICKTEADEIIRHLIKSKIIGIGRGGWHRAIGYDTGERRLSLIVTADESEAMGEKAEKLGLNKTDLMRVGLAIVGVRLSFVPDKIEDAQAVSRFHKQIIDKLRGNEASPSGELKKLRNESAEAKIEITLLTGKLNVAEEDLKNATAKAEKAEKGLAIKIEETTRLYADLNSKDEELKASQAALQRQKTSLDNASQTIAAASKDKTTNMIKIDVAETLLRRTRFVAGGLSLALAASITIYFL